ncbi:MAG: DUF2057 domain-containing protein [Gammaproteobacteria bacterium]|nr:DUF2057 domain-containing protein [Gammaproteobacteria bacterium]MDH5651937.1 DUF2057 domain-containing protein [Gammaproteobacteria bacterium]
MRFYKYMLGMVLLPLLVACGATATGPIKGYDSSTSVDTAQLARIYLPPEIEVLDVDGEVKSTPYITEGMNEVHLLPGEHEMTVKYVKYWGDDVSGSLVRSDDVTLRFTVAASGEYVLKFPQVKDNLSASLMVKKFSPVLEDKQGGRLAARKMHNRGQRISQPPNEESSLDAADIVAKQKPLEKLQFWWKLADKEERKAFQRWVLDQ